MQILDSKEFRQRDELTIANQRINSAELMNVAAIKLTDQIEKRYKDKSIPTTYIFCGNGNNGGDGLMIAKMLSLSGKKVEIFIIDVSTNSSTGFLTALKELKEAFSERIHLLFDVNDFPQIYGDGLIIDALLGCGLSRPIDGLCAQLIQYLNTKVICDKISIDLPSGMHADHPDFDTIFMTDEVLTIQDWKPCFYYKESNKFFRKISTIDIGLDPNYLSKSKRFRIESSMISKNFLPREKYSHKGTYGHGLLIAGSAGMMGASILSAKGALISGIGKLTVGNIGATDTIINNIIEAMSVDIQDFKLSLIPYNAIAIGPGIGKSMHMSKIVDRVMADAQQCTLIIDADALNIIAHNKWQSDIPKNSILTPHPKEFARLFGEVKSHYEMVELQKKMSIKYCIYIILKTANTTISTPSGELYYNITGNPGMAKAGSGDVLTGLLLGYICWMKDPLNACISAVHNHGKAGDYAKEIYGEVSMLPSNIIESIPRVHKDYVENR